MSDYKNEVIDPGDAASRLGKKVSQESYLNCPAVNISTLQEGFRGGVGILWKRHILKRMMRSRVVKNILKQWEMMQVVENDGAGGKPQFATFLNTNIHFYRLGWELIVMCAEDILRRGGLPCIMLNQADIKGVNKKNFPKVAAFFRGYSDALRAAGLANITGETAIMKTCITAFCDTGDVEQLILTLSGACIGLVSKELLIDGSRIRPGMKILGLHEDGYRCNGGGVWTRCIQEVFGQDMRRAMMNEQARRFVRSLTVPSVYYGKVVSSLIGWNPDGTTNIPQFKIEGIAHITGGGIWGKFAEILPPGVGANLDNMPLLPKALRLGYKLSQQTSKPLSEWAGYGDVHGGCGMMLVCHESEAHRLINAFNGTHIRASVVGHTTKSQNNEVQITSRYTRRGRVLSSLDPS